MKKYFIIITLILLAVSSIFISCMFPLDTRVVNNQVVTDCFGNITPCTTNTYSLGDATHYWDTLYVNNVIGWAGGGGGTVTSTGTTGHIPYLSTNTNLANSSITYDNLSGYIGIFDNTPAVELDVTGHIHASGNLGINTINATGDVNSNQDINAGNDLNCVNDADIGDDLIVGGDITVTGTVDGVDVSNHDARHEWGGADEVNIKDTLAFAYPYLLLSPGDSGSYTQTLTGGRGWTAISHKGVSACSGNLANDVTGSVSWESFYLDYAESFYRLRYSCSLNMDGTANSEIWVGFFSDTTTFPTTTSNHIGFRLLNGTLYASNGNGVNGTQTQIDTGLGAWDERAVGFKYMADNIKYYLQNNSTEIATHTTNRPAITNLYYGIWVKTTAASARLALLNSPKIVSGGE